MRRALGLYAAGAVLFIGAAFPFLWMLSTALKPSGEIFATPRFVPLSPTLENFRRLFADTSFLVFFRNSVLVAGATVWRGGAAALTAYEPGEEVGAGGEWREDGSYAAYTVEPMLRRSDTDVLAVDGRTLVTDDGVVVLSDSTRADVSTGPGGEVIEATPIGDLEPGDHVMVIGRRAASGDRLQALAVGTYA